MPIGMWLSGSSSAVPSRLGLLVGYKPALAGATPNTAQIAETTGVRGRLHVERTVAVGTVNRPLTPLLWRVPWKSPKKNSLS